MPIWISVILIIICLIIILFIVLKKFPALAILDAKQMPGEKEAEFKEKIIRQRLERDLSRAGGFLGRIWQLISNLFNNFLSHQHQRLKRMKLDYQKEKKTSLSDRQIIIDQLFTKAEEAIKQEDWDQAEEKLIEIVSLDSKNLPAFFELAKLYFEIKKFEEAQSSWEHSLKLHGQLKDNPEKLGQINAQEIRFCLAEVNQQLNDLDNAIEYVNQALDQEPNNPRYLDLIFDLSIMKKDKKAAQEYFDRLVTVNPENQKLSELKDQIKELEEELAKEEKKD